MITRTAPFRSVTKVSKVVPTYNGVSMAPGMLEMCFGTASAVCYGNCYRRKSRAYRLASSFVLEFVRCSSA